MTKNLRPTISIIIPAYNEVLYLPRLLSSLSHSALCLTHQQPNAVVEIIVVDNGSVDETSTLARTYGAQVLPAPERGIAHARNKGARHSTGSLLIFIDADYRVPHNFLSSIWARFSADSTTSAAGVKVRIEPSECGPITRRVSDITLWGSRRVMNMAFGIFAIRAEYFTRLRGFDESLFAYEDVDLLRRIAADMCAGKERYDIDTSIVVHTSARGIYRGHMFRAYGRVLTSNSARRDQSLCGYWYDR